MVSRPLISHHQPSLLTILTIYYSHYPDIQITKTTLILAANQPQPVPFSWGRVIVQPGWMYSMLNHVWSPR